VTSAGYLRFPHVHDDIVAFVADEDVWLAPAAGGRAWRVSADHAAASHPRISRDGASIAWTTGRYGPPEVYLAGIDGADGRRLSHWGDRRTRVCGWTPDGRVVAVTASGQPFDHFTWAYALDVNEPGPPPGGPLAWGPVTDLAIEADGVALVNGAFRADPALWKRYRGGTSGRMWLRPAAADRFTRVLAGLGGQFGSPMLAGGRLAFLSDHEGTGNLYSCALDGSDLRRHTDHDGFYARNAGTDGRRIVYQCAGDIWLLDGLDDPAGPRRLEISLGAAAGRAPRLISAEDHLGDLSCDHAGRASAIEVRGTVHWLTHRDGPARALSVVPGVRTRLPRVLGRTGQVAWVTDAEGADALEIARRDEPAGRTPPRRLAAGAIGLVADMAASPDGRAIAVAARDGRLCVVDTSSGAVTEIASSGNGEVTGVSWSPDSAWLAWSHPMPEPLRQLRMIRPADPGAGLVEVTDGRFTDTDPVFTADGLYLAFLSWRSFDPVYDAHVFDLSFPYGCRPYLVPLAAATASPFAPVPGGRPVGARAKGDAGKDDADKQDTGKGDAGKDDADKDDADKGDADKDDADKQDTDKGDAGKGDTGRDDTARDDTARDATDEDNGAKDDPANEDGGAAAKPVRVDTAGLGSRIVQIPVAEARYASLRAVSGGLAWLRVPLTGNLGEGGASPGDVSPRPRLEQFDLTSQRRTELADELDWFEVSGDGNVLVVSDHEKLSAVPADRKPDEDNPAERVTIDKSRARFLADPAALWRNAYAEAGRFMRHDFWVADMAEADWDGVLDAYRPLLDRITGPGDFADLLWEVSGELGTSHAYVDAADDDASGDADHASVGLLGADLERDADGRWTVARILPGESSDPRARSPLATPGAQIGPGDTLLAVDGQAVDGAGPAPLLVGAAGKPVELTVGPAAGGAPRSAVVVTLRDDRRLRYQDWVAAQRQRVRELSDGRIGYLHVPDMVSEGWADFHRDLHTEIIRDALVVDVRGNRGGHVSQLVVEKLARRVIGWSVPRGLRPETYPQDAPRGPVVALIDEFAGSDGDIVTAAIKTLGLGPVVGTRTWGGVIGIDGYHRLVEGTGITVPRYAMWLDGFGWAVENRGVDPDVEVVPSPDDHAAGRDLQLETAVRMAVEALGTRPAATAPDTSTRPSRRRPPLPPRPASR
jgi:tricorn protease